MKAKQLTEIFGESMTRQEAIEMLKKDAEAYESFCRLTNRDFQEELISFFMGKSGVQITYDGVFRHIMNPISHPDRLSSMLSNFVGQPLKVRGVLPRDSDRINEKGSLLIMDILVELETGELANVEMQRAGYYFPGHRAACYGADLVMRQYSDLRNREGDSFNYKHLKTVYCIILIGKSTKEFWRFPNQYLHRAQQVFDSGLQMDMLQKYLFIPLDIFQKITENQGINNELEAWLHFLTSTDGKTIRRVVEAYPWFLELYRDVAQFRRHGRKLIEMYSDALKTLDYNTVQYMIEDQKRQLDEGKKELDESKKELDESKKELDESKKELDESKKELDKNKKEINELRARLAELEKMNK